MTDTAAALFEPERVARHEYLDLQDAVQAEASPDNLTEGDHRDDWIPLRMEDDLVLLPGEDLPLLLPVEETPHQDVVYVYVGTAQAVPEVDVHEDLERLINSVGTLAKITATSTEGTGDGQIAAVYEGQERVRVVDVMLSSRGSVLVKICHIPDITDVLSSSSRREWTTRALPPFLYKVLDPVALCLAVTHLGQRMLDPWFDQEDQRQGQRPKLPTTPNEAARYSYWLARNTPTSVKGKQELLEYDLLERLLVIKQLASQTCETLCCRNCLQEVTTTAHIIAMSTSGSQGTFVNPNGYLHQILTVRDTSRAAFLLTSNTPSFAHSYFPGYGWTIIVCSGCLHHLGWIFTAADRHRTPPTFVGLERRSLSIQKSTI